MEWIKVTTQEELNKQVAKGNGVIIDSSWTESSHAVLRESSHAVLWDSSHAVLRDSSHAVLWDSSHAVLRDSSHAELWNSSHAELWDSSHAVLRDFAMAHYRDQKVKVLSPQATAKQIDYPSTVKEWLELKGIKPQRKQALLWKAVRPDGTDFYSGTIYYKLDKEVVDPEWDETFNGECGYGLHLADSPAGARFFARDKGDFKLLQVKVKLDDCRVFGGQPEYPMKLRARACTPIKEFPMDYEGE